MKRIFSMLLCTLMFCGMLMPVAAEVEDFQAEIGNIDCPWGAPTIDGNITDSEGWSSVQPINKANTDGGWGAIPVEVEGSLWRAYDSEYLYIAADIILPEISLCEEEDWIDGDDVGNKPGWDGDVFVFTLDPLNKLRDAGFLSDTSVWYCFGIFEGDVIRTYRTHANEGEVSDVISAKGGLTDTGWHFEAAIPWDTVCKDIEEVSYGDVTLTPAEITDNGGEITCSMIYYDRRYDPEGCERITYHRYVTIATTCVDGTAGIMATPWKINAYGIHMNLLPKADDTTTVPDTTTADTTTAAEVTEVVTDDKGNAVTDEKGNKVTQKVTTKSTTKKATTGTSTGGNAAQTFDIGVAVAFGALAASGIGFVATKKRK
ncbi:MAG: hypothetical protein IJB24_08130 [Clostridia bacterium]|nr:hypothetical protein [Clostridia bacterium]MBQ4602813.1 hypothetical protein [Clostridia bacterium]